MPVHPLITAAGVRLECRWWGARDGAGPALALLHEGGMVEIVDERRVRGGIERTYGLIQSATSLDAADVADATPAEHVRSFATFLGALLADFAAYVDEGDVEARGGQLEATFRARGRHDHGALVFEDLLKVFDEVGVVVDDQNAVLTQS